MKISALYARISPRPEDESHTIESQVDAVRERAKADGNEVESEREYVDVNQSGTVLHRPALERLRDDIHEGRLEVLYVYQPDRLARDFVYQMVLLDEFKKAGVEVVFLNHRYSDRPEDQMLLQMQGVFAQYERYVEQPNMWSGRSVFYLGRSRQPFPQLHII